jgi:uncharacterized membrane protein
MQAFVAFFLFFHVLGAIVSLGPTFAFPLIGAAGGTEPQHANFATRLTERLTDRIVEPVILTMPLTGIGLIWAAEIDLFAPSSRWLVLAIVVYVATLAFSLRVQRPAVRRVIALTGGHPGAAEPLAAGAASAGPGAMGVPPAELPGAIAAVKRNGMILGVAALAIIFLMVVKPSLGF